MYKPSIDDMLSGKQSRYSLVIAVAKRAREITDDYNAKRAKENNEEIKKKDDIIDEKPVLLAIEEFKQHKYEIIEEETIHN